MWNHLSIKVVTANIVVCKNELLQPAKNFNDVWAQSKGCWDKAEGKMSPEDKHVKENGLFLSSNSLCHYDSSVVFYKRQLNGLLWLSNRKIIHQWKSINHFLVLGELYIARSSPWCGTMVPQDYWEAPDAEAYVTSCIQSAGRERWFLSGHIALILSDCLGKNTQLYIWLIVIIRYSWVSVRVGWIHFNVLNPLCQTLLVVSDNSLQLCSGKLRWKGSDHNVQGYGVNTLSHLLNFEVQGFIASL